MGQLGRGTLWVRPIVNRPTAAFARESGGSPGCPSGRAQAANRLPACPTSPAIPLSCRAWPANPLTTRCPIASYPARQHGSMYDNAVFSATIPPAKSPPAQC